jgi:hypothetical protein
MPGSMKSERPPQAWPACRKHSGHCDTGWQTERCRHVCVVGSLGFALVGGPLAQMRGQLPHDACHELAVSRGE